MDMGGLGQFIKEKIMYWKIAVKGRLYISKKFYANSAAKAYQLAKAELAQIGVTSGWHLVFVCSR